MTEEAAAYPIVPSPTAGVDPRVSLATSMHAAPGVYAVLVGSGMSSAAGIPTGWQVVEDLIRKIGIAEGVAREQLVTEPEAWWAQQGRPEPRYNTILPALASTDAARQLLLRGYFDPPPEQGGPILPTAGHDALASLCASGRVHLILTTNFDRLVERALDRAGITPEVISSPTAVSGMTPLTHTVATLVKLHGDYAALGLRNTPEELGTYPPEWNALLDRVFDEFDLVVVGWSADYDTALSDALARSPSRRYPIFWASYEGRLSEEANRLIALRRATVIDTSGADEFLVDLKERIARLDEIATRRRRPAPLRSYLFPPEQTTAPQGWSALPLLQLRAAGAVGPASLDTVGMIRPPHRQALIQALRVAPVTAGIHALTRAKAASAKVDSSDIDHPPQLTDWDPTPGHQSFDHASYRLGGDASVGISSLMTAQLPGYGMGGSVLFKIDVAISIANALLLGQVARLLRDGLVLVTAVLPNVFADILPADGAIEQAEVHLLSATTDGNQKNRPNDLEQRIDLRQLGPATRSVGPSLGFAARLSSPLTEHDAVELVAEAFEYMALASGYLDPSNGITLLRQELGVPSAV